tara:strand:+ start:110 stop:628 length:519 start_codon:yes stop_codon:yes gene_type:complete
MKNKLKKIFTAEDISIKNKELADMVNQKYKNKNLVVMGVMNGAFYFMSDLIKNITIDFQFDTIICSSYFGGRKSTGKVDYLHQGKVDLKDKDILIVEDIVDTGTTVKKIIQEINKLSPHSIEVVSLFLREKSKINYKILWHGYKLKNEFIVGYGLDYEEDYRNLKDVYELIH